MKEPEVDLVSTEGSLEGGSFRHAPYIEVGLVGVSLVVSTVGTLTTSGLADLSVRLVLRGRGLAASSFS